MKPQAFYREDLLEEIKSLKTELKATKQDLVWLTAGAGLFVILSAWAVVHMATQTGAIA